MSWEQRMAERHAVARWVREALLLQIDRRLAEHLRVPEERPNLKGILTDE